MSYQVLARKWRPKTFSDVVGQRHILAALSNGLKENRLHHAYLFSGTRGVGKTSIARLFAKGLNCVNGVTADPCGLCEHCKAIEEGHFIDLIEIDAASRTKVEDTRELLDNVQYKPVQGRYKVYLIDEVHMLSRHSFNALLKTLEEPPEYVKFLLATTDPQKLPITILSRCMQFHLKALEQQQIAQHLEFILKQEKIPFEFLALDKLAKAAQGSIRDSLSLADQAIAMSNSNVTLSIVNEMLGLLDDNQALDIIHALQQGQGEILMQAVQAVAEKGGDWNELLRDIAENLHKIAMQQLLPNPQIDDSSQIGFLASHISPEDVQFFYQVVLTGRKELTLAPTPRIGVEMTLLRALAFHPKLVNVALTSTHDSESKTEVKLVKSANSAEAAYVDMPVVSQTISAQYKRNIKAPISAETHQSNSVQSHQYEDNHSIEYSAALDALAQIDKLDELSLTSQNEKKKRSQPSSIVSPVLDTLVVEDEKKLTALPVIGMKKELVIQRERVAVNPVKPSVAFQQKLTELAPHHLKTSNIETLDEIEELEQEVSSEDNFAETYRWEWRNPELAKMQEGVKPSDLKQSLEQDITPELRAKVVDIARAQDYWTDLVESLNVNNLTKELALNCLLIKQTDKQILLGIKAEKHHLNTSAALQNLQQALAQFQQKQISLSIEVTNSEQLTPTDWYRQTYKALREKAKQDLQQDDNLQLFLKEFNAELDLTTVKPV
ncbi:DNA polymerase III subunit gamma/tau [Pasteurella canis]|uniref:DNA polymerase III subunit gamma/tau n=1 Tax=Pasteurella canis TaxID=753 RepID=A0ABQ4VJG5_9PAST|nr:DNA polymerase III subunit gamma/tau [Pasteurella canis]UEC23672.1 DNA polymerase III subunit gamma/tau [Pasteurella canis]GJH43495.1 DNA polymerase III subunit tau/gamma [Pasteurella canis]